MNKNAMAPAVTEDLVRAGAIVIFAPAARDMDQSGMNILHHFTTS